MQALKKAIFDAVLHERYVGGWMSTDEVKDARRITKVVIDALGLESVEGVYLRDGRPILALSDDMPQRGVEVLYRIAGQEGGERES